MRCTLRAVQLSGIALLVSQALGCAGHHAKSAVATPKTANVLNEAQKQPRGSDWFENQYEGFRILYPYRFQDLVPRVAANADVSLRAVGEVFDYWPDQPLNLILRDGRDTGGGGAVPFPFNRITLQVTPNEAPMGTPGADDYFRWLLTHEMVHIVINDQASVDESWRRDLFGKVAPSSSSPLTLPFSLATNLTRYAPRWFQEGMAVFYETWLNAANGRLYSGFYEMYFRSLVSSGTAPLPADAWDHGKSFAAGMSSYLYGTRFIGYLGAQYGSAAVQRLGRTARADNWLRFTERFEVIFGKSLQALQEDYWRYETELQQQALVRIRQRPLTQLHSIAPAQGWVTQPKAYGDELLFSSFSAGSLSSIQALSTTTGELATLRSLPTPSLRTVASTALSRADDMYFYTTHNSMGYRDIWAANLATGERRAVRERIRTGELAVDPSTGALWGIRVRGADQAMVYLERPWQEVKAFVVLPRGVSLTDLSFSPDGKRIAAILRRPGSLKEVVVIDMEKSRQANTLRFKVVERGGAPENPAWGEDGTLYWSAYVTGVSNIYRKRSPNAPTEQISHTESGLFFPQPVGARMYAFEFTPNGYRPVWFIPRAVAPGPRISYLGDRVLAVNPELADLSVGEPAKMDSVATVSAGAGPYKYEMKRSTLIPTIGSYNRNVVAGVHLEFEDALQANKLTFDVGRSAQNYHVNSQFRWRRRNALALQYNPSSFYDLVNAQGNNLRWNVNASRDYLWLYDPPAKIRQASSVGAQQVILPNGKEPWLGTLGTELSGEFQRRTIGSVDFEYGYQWSLDLQASFAPNGATSQSLRASSVWQSSWLAPHNVARLDVALGTSVNAAETGALFFFSARQGNTLETETRRRYQAANAFMGLSEKGVTTDRFLKYTLENRFPPLQIRANLGGVLNLKQTDVALFQQSLYPNDSDTAHNLGFQNTWYGELFSTIDATLAWGYARSNQPDHESTYFAYLKLFRG